MALTAQSVKLKRQKLNKLENGIDNIGTPSREISLSKTALQESIMFLGLVLGDMDEKNPYPESSNKENNVIEDRADVAPDTFNFESADDNHIGRVKEMREEIGAQIEDSKAKYLDAHDTVVKPGHEPFFPTHLINHLSCLEKAKLWLGMELNRIKNTSK